MSSTFDYQIKGEVKIYQIYKNKNKCTKPNVVFLLSISAEDVQSNTGSNLRRILLDTGIKIIPGSTAHSELNDVNIYEIPAGEA